MDNESREKLRDMVEEALNELEKYSRSRFADHLKGFFKRLAGRKVPAHDRLNWPSGLLANALMTYYKNNLNLEISLVIKQSLTRYYRRFYRSHQKIHYLDNIVAGTALIDLHQATGDGFLKEILDKMVNYLKQHEVDGEGSLLYRPAKDDFDVNVVSIGMICPFLCKYGAVYNDADATGLAVKQVLNFSKYGMDSRTGLPYHGYEQKSGINKGIIGWGRGCGWLLMGLVDSLIYMDKETAEYDEIKQVFRRLVDKVEAYQREDGFYPWQLTAREGYFDTSATAMILYAIARGLEHDILIGIHRSRLLRGWNALMEAVSDGKLYNCLAESEGYALYQQNYDAYPWSLAPAISLFSVNIRNE